MKKILMLTTMLILVVLSCNHSTPDDSVPEVESVSAQSVSAEQRKSAIKRFCEAFSRGDNSSSSVLSKGDGFVSFSYHQGIVTGKENDDAFGTDAEKCDGKVTENELYVNGHADEMENSSEAVYEIKQGDKFITYYNSTYYHSGGWKKHKENDISVFSIKYPYDYNEDSVMRPATLGGFYMACMFESEVQSALQSAEGNDDNKYTIYFVADPSSRKIVSTSYSKPDFASNAGKIIEKVECTFVGEYLKNLVVCLYGSVDDGSADKLEYRFYDYGKTVIEPSEKPQM